MSLSDKRDCPACSELIEGEYVEGMNSAPGRELAGRSDRKGSHSIRIGEILEAAGYVGTILPLLVGYIKLSAADAPAGLGQKSTNMTPTPTTPDTLRYTRIPLNNGSGAIPAVGFGTLIPDPLATEQATKTALEVGFRHFDCAERYRNEQAVGNAIQAALRPGTTGGIRREDLFITTKLWNTNHRPDRVKPAFDASLRRLQIDYADCYLIHTPFAFQPGDNQDPRDDHGQVIYDPGVTLLDTWQALEHLVDDGRCKSIGLSDINLEKLRPIVAAARIKPAVVQVESHPYLPEWELLDFCRQHGIVLLAFAALGHGMDPNLLNDPVITNIAQRLQKTPAQVALAWAVQRGTAFLTTSTKPARIQENFDISTLPDDAMQEMRDGIKTNIRFNTVVGTGVPGFIPRAT
jgi:diketogulonate reductase-like aldo/keto reductase